MFPCSPCVLEGPGQFTDLLWSLVPSHATVSSGSPTGNLFRRCLVRNHQHNNSLNGRRSISAVNPIVIHTYSDRGTLVRGPVFGLGSKLEIMILFYAYKGNQPRRTYGARRCSPLRTRAVSWEPPFGHVGSCHRGGSLGFPWGGGWFPSSL